MDEYVKQFIEKRNDNDEYKMINYLKKSLISHKIPYSFSAISILFRLRAYIMKDKIENFMKSTNISN